jgi:peptide/nickel transport system permease protein
MTMSPPVDAAGQVVSGRAMRRARRRRTWAENWRLLRRNRLAMLGLITLVVFTLLALLAPVISSRDDFNVINTADNPTWAKPSGDFLLGTDNLGRSVALQVLWGARISLFVGLAATLLTIAIGSAIGITAGYIGGRIEGALMRLTDWFLVIPFLPLAIVLAAVLERSLWTIILVIGITSWPSTARLVRAQVLTVRERLFVDRARSLGAGRWHIVRRHVLPNVTPLILANTTLAVPISILTESTLAFLGLGDPTQVSWGGILQNAYDASAIDVGAWWYYLPAGMAIVIVVLSFTLVGRALEEILDPRLRGD